MSSPARKRARSSSTSSEADSVDELDRLLDLAGVGEKIQLLRCARAGESFKYVDQFEPSEMRAQGIREFTFDRCGGSGDGAFRARIRRTDGTYGKSKTFSIEGEPKKYSRVAPESAAATAAATTAAPTSGPESIAMKVALAFALPFATAAAGFLAKKLLERPADDPFKIKMIELMTDRGRRGESISALEVQKIAQEAERRGEERGRELGEMKALIESGNDAAPAANMAQVVDGAVKEFGGVLRQHMALEERRMQFRITPRAGAPATSTTAAPPGTAGATPLNTDDELVQLLGSIPKPARYFLLSAAQEGEDPGAYVPLIVTKLDEDAYEKMAANVQRADFLEVMLAVIPMYKQHSDWFGQLVEQLREYFTAEPVDVVDGLTQEAGADEVAAS